MIRNGPMVLPNVKNWAGQRLRNGQRFRKKCDSLDHINNAKIFSTEGA